MEFFFDLDGTLLDHGRAQAHGVRTLAETRFGLTGEDLAGLPARWLAAEDKHFARYERGEIPYLEHRRERLREVFPGLCAGLVDIALDDLYSVYVKAYQSEWHLYPDALPVLEALAGRPMALITNGESELQRSKVSRLGISRYFKSIIVSGEVGEHKPRALPFLRACKETGVAAADVLYVGDSFANDVMGSRNAGMGAVWLNRRGLSAPSADFEFTSIASLSELSLPKRRPPGGAA